MLQYTNLDVRMTVPYYTCTMYVEYVQYICTVYVLYVLYYTYICIYSVCTVCTVLYIHMYIQCMYCMYIYVLQYYTYVYTVHVLYYTYVCIYSVCTYVCTVLYTCTVSVYAVAVRSCSNLAHALCMRQFVNCNHVCMNCTVLYWEWQVLQIVQWIYCINEQFGAYVDPVTLPRRSSSNQY